MKTTVYTIYACIALIVLVTTFLTFITIPKSTKTFYITGVMLPQNLGSTDNISPVLQALNEASYGDQINLYVDSYGGDAYSGLTLYYAIVATKATVTINVLGHAMSAGAVILCATPNVKVLPGSVILFHSVQSEHGGLTLGDTMDDATYLLVQHLFTIYEGCRWLDSKAVDSIEDGKDVVVPASYFPGGN